MNSTMIQELAQKFNIYGSGAKASAASIATSQCNACSVKVDSRRSWMMTAVMFVQGLC